MNDESKRPADPLTDHTYDGIQEYDNPLPRWWLWIFWVTILFSVLYSLNLPGIGTGAGRIANYERDMAEAKAKYAALQPKAPVVDASLLLGIAHDPTRFADGKNTFTGTCASCHRADGGGNIGPNLTDHYWIHGSQPMQLFTTVSNGVLEKGMPAWSQVYTPEQIVNVVGYVLTLRDTHPKEPKAPQGVEVEDEGKGAIESSESQER
jgi:cytochrome c oxidase cbb3-type subunit 3